MILRDVAVILGVVGGLVVPPSFAAAPPNFADHVAPILEVWCVDCHRGSRGKNGVALQDHAATMTGGSAGAIVVPGDPGASILYLVAAHERDPVMPPDGDRMSDEELATIRDWIAGGCRRDADDEGSGPKVEAMAAIPRPPSGATVMPDPSCSPQPYWLHDRSDAVVALDASPTSPLLAIGGHRQVTLVSIEDGRPLACLSFPEGTVHDLRFSRDGALLVVGGGRDGASGVAAILDVASGARLRTFDGEPDAVLSADLSPDGSMLALGGPDGIVRVIDVADGSELQRHTPHTDWITAVRFSPDGAMLATADRAGGAFIWEAWTGREFHRLPGLGAPATAITWRADSNLAAFATDAGPVAVFDMERGNRIANQSLHGGVLAAAFLPDGRLLTAGRDGRARIGDIGGGETAGWPPLGDLATALAAGPDGNTIAIGGLDGLVRIRTVGATDDRAVIRADPPLIEEIAVRKAEGALATLDAAIPDAERAVGVANDALTTAQSAAEAATRAADAARVRAEAAARALADATAVRTAIQTSLIEPRRRLAAIEAERQALGEQVARLEEIATRRTAEMRAAVDAVTALELTAVMQGEAAIDATALDAARRLAEGATALAQRAIADAGDIRTALAAAEIRDAGWRSAIDARGPELETARTTETAAIAARDEAAAAMAVAETEVRLATAAVEAASAAAAGAQATLAEHRDRRETAGRALDIARDTLARRRIEIAEAGGQVRAEAE